MTSDLFHNEYLLDRASKVAALAGSSLVSPVLPLVPSRISGQKGFSLFPRSIKFHGRGGSRPDQVPPVRSKIFQFSENSRRRLRFTALNAFPSLISQFCLTYHNSYPSDGKELKRQFHNSFMREFRRRFPDTCYLWILEFQKRGAPHFHLFLPFAPVVEIGSQLAEIWLKASGQSSDAAASDFHNHSKNFISWDMGNGSYICKYIEKSRQKDVPDGFLNVGRFWGASRGLVPMPVAVNFDDFADAHDLVDEQTGVCSDAVILAARWLGKWYERQSPKKYRKHRRNFRKLALNTGWTLATGADAFRKIEKYLFKQSEINKECSDHDFQRKISEHATRKARRIADVNQVPAFYQDAIETALCPA